MRARGEIRIGTSGWHYDHWRGPFYPEDLPLSNFLAYYAKRFRTVEINNTFYRMPDKSTLVRWREETPPSFRFAVKASRYLTHMKKLKDARRPLSEFCRRISVLGDRLGPVLFQLPPRWRVNVGRLAEFLKLLPKDIRCAFEFRDPSWFVQEVYDALADAGAAFCIYQFAGLLSPPVVTADLVYLRLHGPGREAYRGAYTEQALAEWAAAVQAWKKEGRAVFCYFDNDEAGFAAHDADRLRELCGPPQRR
jgi:uncharacterized protein YecE (DUF72 family)